MQTSAAIKEIMIKSPIGKIKHMYSLSKRRLV